MMTFGRQRCFAVALLLFLAFELNSSQTVEELFEQDEEAYNREKNKPVTLPENNSFVDFIIVGGGPAGCVLANRLSENPNWNILLLEAGSSETIVNDLPVLASNLPVLTHASWNYSSTPQENACLGMNDNVCSLPRGKILGGTSSINYMLYTRGNPADFDNMARNGNVGWSYREVLPYFLKSEKAQGIELQPPYHNRSGLQGVSIPSYRTKQAKAFIEGCKQLGYPEVDYNGEEQLGVSYVQSTTLNGHRHSASKAFIEPIINKRKNLQVITFAHVTKILIDGNFRAYGVNYEFRKKTYTIRTRKEVILSAGTFNSPHLLMLSGVGPKEILTRHGIKHLVQSPVGQIMYEHMSNFGPIYTTNSTGATLFDTRITEDAMERFENGDPSTIISTLGGIEALVYSKYQTIASDDDRPMIEICLVSGGMASDDGSGLSASTNFKQNVYDTVFKPLYDAKQEHVSFIPILMHPTCYGDMRLRNKDPFTPPIINPNYYCNDEDKQAMLEGIKEAMRIAETPAMKRINATIHAIKVPGCEEYEFATDDYWLCSMEVLSYTTHHQVASCKMGTFDDSTAVVSPQLLVHGMFNLRVADCSVIPGPITAHTNAASLMIGEKAADMIKKDWMNK
ncbi:glucose dehydrogenase [FAD, quinone]-like [Episyrphus balteatus]|uniref:glucose dehydrogenase [FAD, quinone]-like n=1 Tax=Episyrphus balteatus TaxID=286459 RepID=UPI002486BF16|nr:glucose dehydrogenase [FAD, quinone]-like [Episyrphus balteatus]